MASNQMRPILERQPVTRSTREHETVFCSPLARRLAEFISEQDHKGAGADFEIKPPLSARVLHQCAKRWNLSKLEIAMMFAAHFSFEGRIEQLDTSIGLVVQWRAVLRDLNIRSQGGLVQTCCHESKTELHQARKSLSSSSTNMAPPSKSFDMG